MATAARNAAISFSFGASVGGRTVGHEVVRVRTVARHPRIDHGDLGTALGQGEREVRSDESESAGDDAPAPGNGVDN